MQGALYPSRNPTKSSNPAGDPMSGKRGILSVIIKACIYWYININTSCGDVLFMLVDNPGQARC